jgi:hypothetical protein
MEQRKEQTELDVLSDNERQSVDLFKSYLEDTVKFKSKGNTAAAARARKNASLLTKLFKTIRKELQEEKLKIVEAKKALKQ